MAFSIDHLSATPPFEQLKLDVIARIGAGELVVGTRLPTVRHLATELGIAANTVARAYRELESAGFIETRGRAGSFVSAERDASRREALAAAQVYARSVRELGVPTAEAIAIVTAALHPG